MKTKEAIETILGIMKDSEITVSQISQALRAQNQPEIDEPFDLVCKVDGKITRLPYETGKNLNPIGIVPRKNLKFYLSLEETGMGPYPSIEEKDSLPDENLCILMMEVRPELNEKLRELGKPILSGDYWINGHELSGIGYWMARIREDALNIDYFDVKHEAKVRKIGHL